MTVKRGSFLSVARACVALVLCLSYACCALAAEDSLRSRVDRYAKKTEWTGKWIWSAASDGKIDATARRVYLRTRFDVYERATSAVVYCTAVSQYRLYLNGVLVAASQDPIAGKYVDVYDLEPYLAEGANIIAAECTDLDEGHGDLGGGTGFMLEAEIVLRSGTRQTVVSDGTWRASTQRMGVDNYRLPGWTLMDYDDSGWASAGVGERPYLWSYMPPKYLKGAAASKAIEMHKGVPTLMVNGKPHSSVLLWGYPSGEQVEKLRGAGLHLYHCDTWHDWRWRDFDGQLEGMRALDGYVGGILNRDPQALFLPRVKLWAPEWWVEEHPSEYACTDFIDHRHASYASAEWRKDAGDVFRRYLRYIKNSPYGDRFAGFLLNAGLCAEWQLAPPGAIADRSEPTIKAFRTWLRKRYGGSALKLKEAWNTREADFRTALPPTKEQIEREEEDLLYFRDPTKSQRFIDWYQFYSDLTAETILYFAQIVKEETNALCGTFYGYELTGGWAGPQAELFSTMTLLESPLIDFLAGPLRYEDRGLGGSDGSQGLISSVRLHGKTWLGEVDMGPGVNGFPEDPAGASEVMKRMLAWSLVQEHGMWWMFHGTPVFSYWQETIYRHIFKTICDLQGASNFAVDTDRTPTAEIAVLYDARSIFYGSYKMKSHSLYIPLVEFNLNQLMALGTPFDLYLLDDLANAKMPDYKLYIFLNAFHLDERQRQMIDKKVKRNGSVAVWFYAPGFVTDEGFSLDAAEEVTGIRLAYEARKAELVGNLVPSGDPIVKGLPRDMAIGGRYERPAGGGGCWPWFRPDKADTSCGPIFYAADAGATELGKLSANGKPGLVVKRFGQWTSVWSGVTSLPADLWRNFAKSAGVHFYDEGGSTVYANRSWLAVHTRTSGRKTLRLPRASDIYDVFDGRLIGRSLDKFEVSLPEKVTKLYYLGSYEDVASSPLEGVAKRLGEALKAAPEEAAPVEAAPAARTAGGSVRTLWKIGTFDKDYAELAIPRGFLAYPKRFPNDVDFTIGKSLDSKDWAYIHPGHEDLDTWAGMKPPYESKPCVFRIHFTLDEVPRGQCVLRIDFVDTHPDPKLRVVYRVDINGNVRDFRLKPGVSGNGYQDPSMGSPESLLVRFPGKELREGENVIRLSTVEGYWTVYDALSLQCN